MPTCFQAILCIFLTGAAGLLTGCVSQPYRPAFQNASPFLLRHDQAGFTVYYRTTDSYQIGDPVPAVRFLSASNEAARLLDNKVDAAGPGYVAFHFEAVNPSCFAIYENQQWVNDYPVEYPRLSLPQPSDAWLCAEFDFETYFAESGTTENDK